MKNLILLITASLMFACNPIDCTNGIQDGNEDGVDCGGDCPICETCTDGILNQDEVNIDCGGLECIPCSVYYPPNGINGQNVLSGNSDISIPGNGTYSFKAEVPEGSSLKLVLVSNGGDWGYANNVGWSINIYNGTQTFEALNSGVLELYFVNFTGTLGSFLIQYYENSTTITKQKTVTWN